jgi:hypothetical protein
VATLAIAAFACLGAVTAFGESATPPTIESESVSNLAPTDATLEAAVNLHEGPTGVYYQFQLAASPAEYASEILCPPKPQPGYSGCVGPQGTGVLPIGFLSGNAMPPAATLRASLDLAGAGVALQPGTTYHYRLLAATAVQTEDTIEWEPPTVEGADRTFTTPPAGVPPAPVARPSPANPYFPPLPAVPSAPRCAAHPRVLVDFLRSGGLGGGTAHLVVTRAGMARLTIASGTRRTSLAAKLQTRLAKVLRNAHFPRLQPVYEPAPSPADAFTYTITHACRTVRAVDTAVPPALRPVIDLLDRIVTKLSS